MELMFCCKSFIFMITPDFKKVQTFQSCSINSLVGSCCSTRFILLIYTPLESFLTPAIKHQRPFLLEFIGTFTTSPVFDVTTTFPLYFEKLSPKCRKGKNLKICVAKIRTWISSSLATVIFSSLSPPVAPTPESLSNSI